MTGTNIRGFEDTSVRGGRRGRGARRGLRHLARGAFAPFAVAAAVAGCDLDGLVGNDELPADVSDPSIIETPAGAVAAYYGVVAQFRSALGSVGGEPWVESTFAAITGLLTDELQSPNGRSDEHGRLVDRRSMVEGEENRIILAAYSRLQRVRGQASQAIGLLSRYAPADRQPLAGHAYALQGYAEVFLAELFCSGIPLSTLDFDGDYTYRPGSTTDEVYEHAVELFDRAIELAGDSTRFVHLAQVGRARAFLGLGRFADAAAAAATVPDGYRYEVVYSAAQTANGWDDRNFARRHRHLHTLWELTVPDREGANGIDYRSGADPRTRVRLLGANDYGTPIYHPEKYDPAGASPIVLASGVEARLVEAEAALRAGADWLGILNALRTDGTFTTQPDPDDPAQTDTIWNAGTGGVDGLAPLADPGNDGARVDLLFRERAAWLFLTGHRQGDLRRLIRHYGRAADDLYPVGVHPYDGGLRYGQDVTVPIPPEEGISNPEFTGCYSRGA